MATITANRIALTQLQRRLRTTSRRTKLEQIEIVSLWLAIIVNSTMWIAVPLLYTGLLPAVLVNELCVYTALPAAFLGCFYYFRFGGFAKSPALLMLAVLMLVALLWTVPSELHRGLSAAAIFAESLPIAALINKHRYQWQLSSGFIVCTVIADCIAALDPAIGLKYGTIEAGGISVANSDGVSIQSAVALILLAIALSKWKGTRGARNAAALLFLPLIITIALCGSRTAVIGLAGALTYAFVRSFQTHVSTAVLLMAVVLVPIPVFVLSGEVGFGNPISEMPIFNDKYGNSALHVSDRTEIYKTATDIILGDFNWAVGVGPGGVDERLGREPTLKFREINPDGVTRAYAHSTYIWTALGLGAVGVFGGLVLIGQMFRYAFLLDQAYDEWQRVSVILFFVMAAAGVVFNVEFYWNMISALVWSMLSPPLHSTRNTQAASWRRNIRASGTPALRAASR